MSSPYDYQPDPYRRERLPPRPPSQVTSPPYPYYPGRPGSTTSTYAPAPTVVSVPRDIIYVQAPPSQPRNFLRDLVAPEPPKPPVTMSYLPQAPSQQQSLLQPPRYTDGSQYHRPPIPPLQNPVYNPVNGLPAAPARSPAVHNVFHEGQSHYETMGVQPHESQQTIVKVGSLILERMQARINDPQSTEELRNVARATFINVAKAFGVLVDPIAREAYDREIGLRPMYEEYDMPAEDDHYPPAPGSSRDHSGHTPRLLTRNVSSPGQSRHTDKTWLPEKNPYESLGISPDATTADITKAFSGFEGRFLQARDTMDARHLALAQKRMAERKRALKFLLTPKNRARYAKYLLYGSDASDEEEDDDRYSPGGQPDMCSNTTTSSAGGRYSTDDEHKRPPSPSKSNDDSRSDERLQQISHASDRVALPAPPGSVISEASTVSLADSQLSRVPHHQQDSHPNGSPSTSQADISTFPSGDASQVGSSSGSNQSTVLNGASASFTGLAVTNALTHGNLAAKNAWHAKLLGLLREDTEIQGSTGHLTSGQINEQQSGASSIPRQTLLHRKSGIPKPEMPKKYRVTAPRSPDMAEETQSTGIADQPARRSLRKSNARHG